MSWQTRIQEKKVNAVVKMRAKNSDPSLGIPIEDRPALEGNFVYIVQWPDGVIKAGYASHRKRWRKFIGRHAKLLELYSHPTATAALASEDLIHRWAREWLEPAFTCRQESEQHLGRGGGGFTECYQAEMGFAQNWREMTVNQ